MRLGELVGRGIGGPQGAGGGALPGFGGVQDPWKALEVKWEDAPMHWPTRVSPWEVRSHSCLVTSQPEDYNGLTVSVSFFVCKANIIYELWAASSWPEAVCMMLFVRCMIE